MGMKWRRGGKAKTEEGEGETTERVHEWALDGRIVGKSNGCSNHGLSSSSIIFCATSAETLTLSCARL
jgi:hypothetical protein